MNSLPKIFALMAVVGLTSGCWTGLAAMGARERRQYATVAAVYGAHATDESVFVHVDVVGHDEVTAIRRIVEIPIEEPTSAPARSPFRFSTESPRVETLSEPAGLPAATQWVEVYRAAIDDLDELARVLQPPSKGFRVYAVTYTPDLDNREYRDPIEQRERPASRELLSVVYPPDECSVHVPDVILAFHQDSYRHWGYYALMPATVAADVVTFPLQFLAFLMMDCDVDSPGPGPPPLLRTQ